jgi:hypothetical protein
MDTDRNKFNENNVSSGYFLEHGERISYDKLCLCTGASPQLISG